MATRRRGWWRTLRDWMRVVLPPGSVITTFLIGLVGLEALAHSLLAAPEFLDPKQYREAVLLVHAPRNALLGIGLVMYGAYRVVAMHPFFRPEYAEWLSQTPWHARLPLPLGPVRLVPQDGVVFLLAWLVSLHASALGLNALVALLLCPYLLAMILPLRAMKATPYAYLIAFGLATAVWLTIPSTAATLVLIALYVVAWHGLPGSLNGFAWNVSPEFYRVYRTVTPMLAIRPSKRTAPARQPVGFPFAQLSPRPELMTISPSEALLISALAGWLLLAATSHIPDAGERASVCVVLSTWGIIGAAFARAVTYFFEYRPPISLLGRIATRRLIIPGFDVALVPFAAAASVLLAAGVASPWLSPAYTGPLALAAAWSLLIGMPPSLRDRALTGNHRIVGAARRSEFIEI